MDPKEHLKKLIQRTKERLDPQGAEKEAKQKSDEKLDSIGKSSERMAGFLDSIKGEKGDKGDNGKDAKDGKDGRDGKDGKNGLNGRDGKDGKDGIGLQGPPGAATTGPAGKDGIDGKDGKNTTPQEVIAYLKTAKEEDKLDITHLRNYQQFLPKRGSKYKLEDQRWHGGGSNDAIISFIIDGGGSAITTGIKGDLAIQFNCIVNEVELLADTAGSIVVDIWMADYASYPPTVANTITGASVPTISTDIKSRDDALTGWTRDLALGDTLRYNVVSATAITRCLVSLKVTKK